MAIFSVNQVNHVYPCMTTTAGEAGYLVGVAPKNKDYFYFKHVNALKEPVRSDIIKKDLVMWAKYTPASKMQIALKGFIVELDSTVNGGAPVAGQDYLLRITIPQYGGMSDMHTQVKHGVVRATSGMDASAFYKTMASSLAKNFSRELAPIFKFSVVEESEVHAKYTEVTATTKIEDLTGTYTGIYISEVEQEWVRGIKPYAPVMVTKDHIQPDAIIVEGEETIWGTVKQEDSGTIFGNGKTIADLEYFSMGDRGDLYRNVGWPHVVPTNYLVDPEQEYDVLTIHYAYVGPNEGVQKSEKDITIVGTPSNLSAIKTFVKGVCTLEEVEVE